MRRLFLLFIASLFVVNSYHAQEEPEIYSRGGFFESVFDQEGNAHLLRDLQIEPNKKSSRGGGGMPACGDLDNYFELYYDEGSGFESPTNAVHQQRRDVLCKVLSDLSRFVIPVNSNTHVKLRITPYIQTSNNDGVLAAASSYYAYPIGYPNTGGIIDNLVWKTINSGVDAYFDIASVVLSTDPGSFGIDPTFYHGEIFVNFYDEDDDVATSNTNPVHWNLDYTTSPSSEEFDLYSVLLHEIIHALGFASNINVDGTGYGDSHYTRYDKFLKTAAVSHPEGNLPLIYTEGETCSMYWENWNPIISTARLSPSNPATDFDPNNVGPPSACDPETDSLDFFNSNCYNAMRFVGSIDVPVMTPLCFERGRSLSHLEDQCVAGVTEYDYYLMAAGFPEGGMRRYLQSDERSILCDLGYHLNDRFGFASNGIEDDGTFENEMVYTSVCGGIQVVGINDGLATDGSGYSLVDSDMNSIISISGLDLLSNDLIGGISGADVSGFSFQCLEPVFGDITISVGGDPNVNSGSQSSTITITNNLSQSNFGGFKLLRYVPVNGNVLGNITYVYLYFPYSQPSTATYFSSSLCGFGGCNILNNGDFEEDVSSCSHMIRPGYRLTCWNGSVSTYLRPIYFTRTQEVTAGNCPNQIIGSGVWIEDEPIVGLNQNTTTSPPTDSYNGEGNDGIVMIMAQKYLLAGSLVPSSTRIQGELSNSLVPGQTYKLSYYAKTVSNSLNFQNCTNCGDVIEQQRYMNNNLPALPRFLIAEIYIDPGAVQPGDTQLWGSDADDVVSLADWSSETPLPIEPVGPYPTGTSDWHYREMIFQVPASAANNYMFFLIDYDIWNTDYGDKVVGYFLDDVTLQPYYGEVVSLPDEICEGAQIEDLFSYNNYPTLEGTFSCPICPEGTLGIENNSFDSNVSGIGEFQVIFTYENSQGCERTDSQTILVTEGSLCCSIGLVIDDAVDSPCPDAGMGKAFITVTGVGENYDVVWNGPTSSVEEDPQDLLPGSYTVTVSTSETCSVSESIEIGVIPSVDPPTINSQLLADQYLNNQVVHISGDLVFTQPNTTWEVVNCQLYFDPGNKINVNEGAGVGFFNVTLDACGPSWQGIVLRSTSATSTTGGMIKNAQNLTVMHAKIGIDTRDSNPNVNTPVDNYRCGIMWINNSHFIDNQIALNVLKGKRLVSPTGSAGIELKGCDFTWTDDITNHFPDFYSDTSKIYMVNVGLYNNIHIHDCQFNNLTTDNQWRNRGEAIRLRKSKADIRTTIGSVNLLEISGFKIGINNLSLLLANLGTKIQGIYAEKNLVGIHANASSFISVVQNEIHVGMPFGTPEMAVLDASERKYEGISVRSISGYEISENEIFGHISQGGKFTDEDLPYSVGITVSTCLSPNEEIYNNHFHNLNWANIANGNNNSSATNGGLRYVCNTNDGNDYDFVVADFPNMPPNARIGEVQTDFASINEDQERSAGNTFTQGNTAPANDFYVESQPGGVEYRYFNTTAQFPQSINVLVIPDPLNTINLCESEISLLSNPDGSTNLVQLNNWISRRDSAKLNWLETKYTWISLIDGGDSETLREEIGNAYNNDTWTERTKLLGFSPYLSDSTLYIVANNTTLFPHPVAMEIILANPHILVNKPFMDNLEFKTDPMPEYMIDILMDVEDFETSRTILQRELGKVHGEYLDAAQKVMRTMIQDSTFTTENRLDELRSWHSLSAYMMVIDQLMEEQDFVSAESEFNTMIENCMSGKEEQDHIDSYYTWLDLYARICGADYRLDSMPQFYIDEMMGLADTYPYHIGGMRAAEVLNEFHHGHYEFEPFAPSVPAVNKAMKMKREKSEIQILKSFPDPTSDLLNIQLSIPEQLFKPSIIKFFDPMGRQIHEIPITRHNEVIALNTSSWSAGIYHLILYTDGEVKHSSKFSIVR